MHNLILGKGGCPCGSTMIFFECVLVKLARVRKGKSNEEPGIFTKLMAVHFGRQGHVEGQWFTVCVLFAFSPLHQNATEFLVFFQANARAFGFWRLKEILERPSLFWCR